MVSPRVARDNNIVAVPRLSREIAEHYSSFGPWITRLRKKIGDGAAALLRKLMVPCGLGRKQINAHRFDVPERVANL